MVRQFSAGPHGGGLDLGGAPAGDRAGLLDGPLFQIEQADHDLFARIQETQQLVEEPGEDLPLKLLLAGEVAPQAPLDEFRLRFRKVRVRREHDRLNFFDTDECGPHSCFTEASGLGPTQADMQFLDSRINGWTIVSLTALSQIAMAEDG